MSENEKDVWEAATLLIAKRGPMSVEYAQGRAREALHEEDISAHTAWLSIADAAREFLRAAGQDDLVN